MNIYTTNADGLSTITTETDIKKNDLVHIYDNTYANEDCLFKVRDVHKGHLELKLVKVEHPQVVSVEEAESIKPTKLFTNNQNSLMVTADRLNKNQILKINGEFLEVSNIVKNKKEPKFLELEKPIIVSTKTLYPLYKRSQVTHEETLQQYYNSYYEVILACSKLRSLEDNFYYYRK